MVIVSDTTALPMLIKIFVKKHINITVMKSVFFIVFATLLFTFQVKAQLIELYKEKGTGKIYTKAQVDKYIGIISFH